MSFSLNGGKKILLGVVGFCLLMTTGCGVNFYFGRPSDLQRIDALSSNLDQLQVRKTAESKQLQDVQSLLQQKLRREIADKQVKLKMAERGLVLTFLTEVLFDSGQANIRKSAEQTLGKVASVIQDKVADREVGVEGHTDNEPIQVSQWKSNWELSTARAISVLHVLESRGVNPAHLVAAGYGEYRPVMSNKTLGGRQQNRRVEIVILPKKFTDREREIIRRGSASSDPEVARKAQTLSQYK